MRIRSGYSISRDSMEEILQQYFHPSLEDAQKRDQMMKDISESMHIKHEGTKDIVTHLGLDLSFLDNIPPLSEQRKKYYKVRIDGYDEGQ